jgi:DNA-binding MarR family transcriptional regulator
MQQLGTDFSLSLLLSQAEHGFQQLFNSTLTAHDLNPEQWRVLAVLGRSDGLPMSDIAEQAVLPPASLTRQLDKLVARNLVIRRIDRGDRRKVLAVLSMRGTRLVHELMAEESHLRQHISPDLVIALQVMVRSLAE